MFYEESDLLDFQALMAKLKTAVEVRNMDPEDDWNVCFKHFRPFFKCGQGRITELTENHVQRQVIDVSAKNTSLTLKLKGKFFFCEFAQSIFIFLERVCETWFRNDKTQKIQKKNITKHIKHVKKKRT